MSSNTSSEVELEKAKQFIHDADLSPVFNRLVQVEKWSKKDANEVIKQYRNYLFLRKKYPQYDLPPSKDIDEAWHAHVLHTENYREFCEKVFVNEANHFLDHHPQGTERKDALKQLKKLFEQTQELYRQEFGEFIYQITGRSFIGKMLDKLRDTLLIRFPNLQHVLEK